MQKPSRPRDKWRNIVFGGIGLLVILADQLSKAWIRANLAIGQSVLDVGFFQIIHVNNTGAAFGMFKDYTLTLIIIVFIGIAAILLVVFIWRGHWHFLDSMLVRSAIALILGGMIGNQIDRLRLGHVTDFLDFKVWPVFNIADMAGVVGAIMIAYYIIFRYRPVKHQG